jgi:hypothetical protein
MEPAVAIHPFAPNQMLVPPFGDNSALRQSSDKTPVPPMPRTAMGSAFAGTMMRMRATRARGIIQPANE